MEDFLRSGLTGTQINFFPDHSRHATAVFILWMARLLH
jgi:hypothetical protein